MRYGTSPSQFKPRKVDIIGISCSEDPSRVGGDCVVPFKVTLCVPKVPGATGPIVGLPGFGTFTPNGHDDLHWDLFLPGIDRDQWGGVFSAYAKGVGCQQRP